MKFEEILPALREEKRVRRKDKIWQNFYGFIFIKESGNKILSDNVDSWREYILTKEDLLADDWEIMGVE